MKTSLRLAVATVFAALALMMPVAGTSAKGLTDPAEHARVAAKAPEGSFQVATHRRGHALATGLAIGAGAVILGGALASGARASECRYVERCTPVTECWREYGRRVCETTGERCRSVRVCD